MTKKQKTKKELIEEIKKLNEFLKDALEVLRQIDKLPMESYHLNKFKEKYREELK